MSSISEPRAGRWCMSVMGLLLALLPSLALAWEAIPGHGFGNAVAVDGAGDVIAAGTLGLPTTSDFAVVKLAGPDGTELWRFTDDGAGGEDLALGLVLDASGNPIAAGALSTGGPSELGLVVKLSGATGSELWRYESGEAFSDVVLDPSGDVIAKGGTSTAPVVAKLSAATGAELWRIEVSGVPSGFFSRGLATEANGDVIAGVGPVVRLRASDGLELWRGPGLLPETGLVVDAAGDVITARPTGPFPYHEFLKLSGADGSVLWTTNAGGDWRSTGQVALVPGGDALVAIGLLFGPAVGGGRPAAVVRLAGATGAEVWRHEMPTGGRVGTMLAVTIDATGHVIAGGEILGTQKYDDANALLAKLSLAGDELWQRESDGLGGSSATTFDSDVDGWGSVAAHPEGDAVAAGIVKNFGVVDFIVTRVRVEAPGRRLLVRDSGTNPARRRLVLQSSGPGLRVATPGGPADPTLAGAQLELFNPTTAESATVALPPAHWTGLGTPAGSVGYAYLDAALADGPCKTVLIKKSGPESLKAQCQGAGIAFTLDEPAQGSLGVRLTTGAGADAVVTCTLFGGTVLRDVAATSGRVGIFNARNAPAPAAACP